MILISDSLFFFNATATTEIYTLSLHDALPICSRVSARTGRRLTLRPSITTRRRITFRRRRTITGPGCDDHNLEVRSEEHTSELQSLTNLVCRLLLEKKKNTKKPEL